MQYHYADANNQVIGPISAEELHTLYRSGTISPDTNIFPEGAADWRAYRTLTALPPNPPSSLAPTLYAQQLSPSRIESSPVAVSTQKCPFCAEHISLEAKKCKHCGETIDVALRAAEEAKRSNANPMVFMNAGGASSSSSQPSVVVIGNQKSGLVAAFLNLIIPGLGYMYCGRFFLGCFVFVVSVALIAATAGIAGLVVYPIVFIDGFLSAGRANRRMIVVR